MDGVTEMTNWAVDLIDVRKTYAKSIEALRGVNIQVGRGEIFGLLGPNGAGKTTLVKIMMSVVRPTHAFGTILGRPLGHRGKLATTGYLPESPRFPPYLTGFQLLEYYAALARVPRARRKDNAKRLLDRLWLTEWGSARIDKYSKGMLQRLGIAQALMNDPELLVLDEPTDGLDPNQKHEVRQLIKKKAHTMQKTEMTDLSIPAAANIVVLLMCEDIDINLLHIQTIQNHLQDRGFGKAILLQQTNHIFQSQAHYLSGRK